MLDNRDFVWYYLYRGGDIVLLRKKYLDVITPFVDKKLIKVLVGIRRSGKTVLLSQIKDLILNNGVPAENIIDINFESMTVNELKQANKLYSYITDKVKDLNGRVYLFFDEIQEVEKWEKAVNSFLVDFDCDIYITGSNSNLLSGELATYLSGRYVQFKVYPFSFSEAKEYLLESGQYTTDEKLFADYLRFGGLPQRFAFSDEHSVKTYLEDVLEAIVIKDVIARNNIKDIDLLQRLLNFILDNVGNTFSARSICDYLGKENRATTTETINNYIQYFKNAMIICVARRYDIKGKNLLKTLEKYYAVDLGLRNIIKSSEQIDSAKLYENIVYLEMLCRGYEVRVGKLAEQEIDFICYKGKDRIYIQVAYLLDSEKTLEREFGNLEKITDNYPKYVISGDLVDFSKNGIRHFNIIDFLLDG
jgi:predicted AAA+ superfamily ATPase